MPGGRAPGRAAHPPGRIAAKPARPPGAPSPHRDCRRQDQRRHRRKPAPIGIGDREIRQRHLHQTRALRRTQDQPPGRRRPGLPARPGPADLRPGQTSSPGRPNRLRRAQARGCTLPSGHILTVIAAARIGVFRPLRRAVRRALGAQCAVGATRGFVDTAPPSPRNCTGRWSPFLAVLHNRPICLVRWGEISRGVRRRG